MSFTFLKLITSNQLTYICLQLCAIYTTRDLDELDLVPASKSSPSADEMSCKERRTSIYKDQPWPGTMMLYIHDFIFAMSVLHSPFINEETQAQKEPLLYDGNKTKIHIYLMTKPMLFLLYLAYKVISTIFDLWPQCFWRAEKKK